MYSRDICCYYYYDYFSYSIIFPSFFSHFRIYTQEVLVAIALLCDSPWNLRAKLIFNIFKCIGTEEMSYEDFILAVQVVVVSLCRLWKSNKWDIEVLTTVSESIADNAYTKVCIFYVCILFVSVLFAFTLFVCIRSVCILYTSSCYIASIFLVHLPRCVYFLLLY